jgi:hypothetical protein
MQLGCHEPICIQLYVKQAQVSTRMCDVSTRSGLVQPLLWRRVACKHAVLSVASVVGGLASRVARRVARPVCSLWWHV